MDTITAIKTRRSIRHYKNEDITEEQVKEVIESARWAPSWANTQCCKYIIIRNPETKEKLANTLTPHNPALNAIKTAPVVIVQIAELKKSGFKKEVAVTDKGDYWFMFDAGIAMQNLVLAAHSLGLGTVHVGAFDAKAVANILSVPDNFAVVEMTPLGYPAEIPNPVPRKPLEEIIRFEKF